MIGLVVVGALAVSACSSSSSPPKTSTDTPRQLLAAGISAQASGNLSKARDDYSAIVAQDPQNHSGENLYAYYDLGVVDQTMGRLPAAETEYQAALGIDPTYVSAMYNLAVAQTTTAPQQAMGEYEALLKVKPRDANSTYNLGLLFYDNGKVNQGRVLIREAIDREAALRARLPKNVKL
jgi:tetratricopeptide (TPR) repeat protein